jgi:hypothetical protein
MTWLAPWALAGGALGMLGIVAAHLLSRQRPRALALATARFLPSGMLEATTVQRVPQDRWWMLLRLLIVALLAMGVAQPVLTGREVPTRTVLLLDRTLGVDVQQSVLATLSADDAVIPFDSLAAVQTVGAVAPVRAANASLSAALGALLRARDSLAVGAEAVRVVVASPFAPTSLDPATERVRALLRDSITILPVTVAADSAVVRGAIAVRAMGDDPIAATALLLGDSVAPPGTVIERGTALDAQDVAAAARGAAVVHWPARETSGDPVLQALTVHGTTWIAPMQRDTASAPAGARASGWWADGTPAVWRRDTGTGCLLTVQAALPDAGDHSLSLAAQAWLRALVTVCERDGGGVNPAPAWFAAAPSGRTALVATQTLSSGIAPWFIVAALVLAAVELALRTMRRA